MTSLLSSERHAFHQMLLQESTLVIDPAGIASNADGSQSLSRGLARSIAERLGATRGLKVSGQTAGQQFEVATQIFLQRTFPEIVRAGPDAWTIMQVGGSRGVYQLSRFEPYSHLEELARAVETNPTLASVLGNSYEISPDVLVIRSPVGDAALNENKTLVDDRTGTRSPLRSSNQTKGLVHAVISCKWTLRSDRAQNARSEALSLIRNRKGRVPHIAVVTAEPLPSRIASLALGTGDIDTVYHFALEELIDAVEASGHSAARRQLEVLLSGKRLRDIADLPLDLAI